MAILWVDEGYKKELDRKINSYKDELSDIKKMYTKAMDQASAYMGDYNVSSCNTFLQKRKKALDNASSNADDLKYEADRYVERAVSADKTVSSSIHSSSYSLYKKKGIGPQSDSALARGWNSFTTGVEDFIHDAKATTERIIQDIEDFYEEYKYIFDVVFDIIALSAAVALFALSGGTLLGVICAIGATWATSKALFELATDCMAVDAWLQGDEGRAAELNGMTLSGAIVDAGEWLDETLNVNFFEDSFKVLLVGLEGCQFVANMMMVWESFRDIFNLKVRSDGKPLKILDHRVKLTSAQRELGWAMFNPLETMGQGGRFKSALNVVKFAGWSMGFSFKKDAKSSTEFVFSLLKSGGKNKNRLNEILTNPKGIVTGIPGFSNVSNFWHTSGEILAM